MQVIFPWLQLLHKLSNVVIAMVGREIKVLMMLLYFMYVFF